MNNKPLRRIRTRIFTELDSQLHARGYDQVRDRVFSQVFNQIGDQVFRQIDPQIFDQIDSQIHVDQFTLNPQLLAMAMAQTTL